MNPFNIAILSSGYGSNLQAIMKAFKNGWLRGKIVLVISNNSQSGAMERARQEGIPSLHLSSYTHPNQVDPGQFHGTGSRRSRG